MKNIKANVMVSSLGPKPFLEYVVDRDGLTTLLDHMAKMELISQMAKMEADEEGGEDDVKLELSFTDSAVTPDLLEDLSENW